MAVRAWYKSSYSAQANDCVETGRLASNGMAVRDSKGGLPPRCGHQCYAASASVTDRCSNSIGLR
ncbi:DUF397 domain-containing protein [Kitasatospora cathayae]|uniref:DUF397 domain-containing protein n=2 Tax=Kitasatospora cathayae TaxID=3004092 RepID=A0ABY7QFV3_9ACTN|nr:DUF397 domain-containing protein [Kitasatospora sp. HUAS 3-15]WBP91610.1 DUF397 domain-containing protein [Kitasatospora sp. HUAS 3-15]